jgi:hypothetical protein
MRLSRELLRTGFGEIKYRDDVWLANISLCLECFRGQRERSLRKCVSSDTVQTSMGNNQAPIIH